MNFLKLRTKGENGFEAELKPCGGRLPGLYVAANDVLVTGTGDRDMCGFGLGIDPTGLTDGFHVT